MLAKLVQWREVQLIVGCREYSDSPKSCSQLVQITHTPLYILKYRWSEIMPTEYALTWVPRVMCSDFSVCFSQHSLSLWLALCVVCLLFTGNDWWGGSGWRRGGQPGWIPSDNEEDKSVLIQKQAPKQTCLDTNSHLHAAHWLEYETSFLSQVTYHYTCKWKSPTKFNFAHNTHIIFIQAELLSVHTFTVHAISILVRVCLRLQLHSWPVVFSAAACGCSALHTWMCFNVIARALLLWLISIRCMQVETEYA